MAIDTEQDYIELLDILIMVVDANRGTPSIGDERALDAEGLALKFFGHTVSAFYLYRGVTIPELTIPITRFPDATSVHVLGRAAFETFLIFHYIFDSAMDRSEQDLRYLAWQLSGVLERKNFPVWSIEAKEQLRTERKIIDDLIKKIKAISIFTKLPSKQQKGIIEQGKWRLKSWKEIALSAGLSDIHAESYYSYLCGYAHSGSLSVLQWRQARSYEEKRDLMGSTINLNLIAIANMISCYCKVFPKSNEYYIKNHPPQNVVELWLSIGASTKDEIEKVMQGHLVTKNAEQSLIPTTQP